MVTANEGNTNPRFIADAMLGKLARWLRALGYDTLYLQGDDHFIAARARAEGRILLTRDTELAHRRGLGAILIESQKLRSQLTQVVQTVGPPAPHTPARCMHCNGSLHSLSLAQARPLVPPYVAETQKTFHQCQNCGRVYWQGTHWQKIQTIRHAVFQFEEDP
jgi:uncharacterized protein with PIN domain